MKKTARQRRNRANKLAFIPIVLLLLGFYFSDGNLWFVFPLVPMIWFAYAIWRIQFACPKCGEPYLYSVGIIGSVKFLTDECSKCGFSSDEPY